MTDSFSAARPAPPPRRTRVLIVDDSALMRRVMTAMVNAEPDMEVVDVAHDGADVVAKIERCQPDVVTLDVEMPGTDGLTALRELMAHVPRPVVMVSYLTSQGADATMRALMLGAVEVVAKPSGPISVDLESVRGELVQKIRIASHARVVRRERRVPERAPDRRDTGPATRGEHLSCERLVAIGASTGGPSALTEVVAGLPDEPGVGYLVVQHMPAWLTPWLAERLGAATRLRVCEAAEGDHLQPGTVLVAPGDRHLRVGHGGVIHLDDGPKVNRVRPSVDVAFLSAVEVFGPRIVSAVLTGIGEDGAAGAAAIHARGGYVIAEDEATCVVWGMPRAVVERGAADKVVPLDGVAGAIRDALAFAHA